MDATSKPPPLA